MATGHDAVDLPVVVVQLNEGSYRGPSISSSVPRVIAIEERKHYILELGPATLWQLPLVPANASIVHKTQSFPRQRTVIVGMRFRAARSWYVPLSRVKDPAHDVLVQPITWSDIGNHKRELT